MRRIGFVLLVLVLLSVGSLSAQEDTGLVLQVVDTDPLAGELLSLRSPVTFYFDRELDCDTAPDAVTVLPTAPGDVSCAYTAVTFTPSESYQLASSYRFILGRSLRGADGSQLAESFVLELNTPSALEVLEVLPEPDTRDVATSQQITVIFNRPVVPLGTVEDMDALPDPLTFSPPAGGEGGWLNTSIYTFKPQPNFSPSTTYTVRVDPTLQAIDGTALGDAFSWSFTTEPPEVVTFTPNDGTGNVRLDPRIQLVFSTDVDRESFEENFYLRPSGQASGSVAGTFEWSTDEGTDYEGTGWVGVSFVPDERLDLDTAYVIGFPANRVFDSTGSAAFPETRWNIATVPYPAIVGTDPFDGQQDVSPYGGFTLYFASPMDQSTLNDKITIEPEPWRDPDYYYQTWDDGLSVSFPKEPSTTYTITVAPGMADVYGNTIDTSFVFSFRTSPYDPDVSLQVPGPVGFYNAYREETQVFVTHRNVSRLDLNLYSVPLADFAQRAANEESYYDPAYDFVPRSENLLRSWQIESVAPLNALRYELLSLAEGGGSTAACVGAPPARVRVGDSAIVITEPDPLRARSAPVDGEIVELLYKDYTIPIVGGPVCADGLLWWEVQLRDDSTGWVAEGTLDEYFIDLRTPQAQTPVTIPQEFADGTALTPGVYFLGVSAPEIQRMGYTSRRHFMIVATANLVVKTTVDSVTVWATDVQTGQPISNAPITIHDSGFNVVAEGVTDADGLMQVSIPRLDDLYIPRLAVLQTDEHFGLGLTSWSDGIEPWYFGMGSEYYPQRYRLYMYTDRPIYRPDQPVYFRGVLRLRDDVTYTPPDLETVPVQIYDDKGEIIYSEALPLTEFGTFSDSFELAEDAALGFYRISVDLPTSGRYNCECGSVFFNVAEYRLPEFQVTMTALGDEVVQGDSIEVEVESRYFFGGVVSSANVEYNVVANPHFFNYQGTDGYYAFNDFDYDSGPSEYYGSSAGLIASGSGTTDDRGRFRIEIPADLKDATQSQVFTIEAIVRDESNQVVAGRTDVIVHQGNVYIGVRPEQYVGTANEDTTLNFIAVDWDSNPVAGQEINIEIVERRWSSTQEVDPTTGRTNWTWELEEIPITDGSVMTGDNGRVDWSFVPPYGGIFKVTATSRDDAGNEVRASTTLWVSSREYVSWRQQNSNRIDLIADADDYAIGDTAEILITSPFQGTVEALVTVERGDVLKTERITMDSNSFVYQLPIEEDFAPNVYVSVLIVKGVDETNPVAGFRMGLVQLGVEIERKELTIEAEPDREQAGPGETVTYTIRTTDYKGDPVQAEVGIGLTDLASLSIGDPNSPPILGFYYGQQPVGVRTATPLTINTDQITQTVLDTIKGGGGGFGEGGIFDIREEFVDTAYWNGALVTDENGVATFEVTLPDNLTTWRLDARAVTSGADGLTLVGQNTFDLLSTKPLLIRPVTPRFFVVGDAVTLAAIVNNNTGAVQSAEVALEGTGVTFDGESVQTVVIPAGGRQRVTWDVTIDDVQSIDLTFFARSEDGEYTDASKPPLGQGEARLLPVYRYEAPEITGTGGVLRDADSRTEAIILPRRFDVSQGELAINVERSLAATATETLDYLRNYCRCDSAEGVISRMLPNIMTYRALEQLGLADDELRDNLSREVQIAIQRLNAWQKVDGGWGWYFRDESNPLVTAWALIGLTEAQRNGFAVDGQMIGRARSFLTTQFITLNRNIPVWRLDRQAFILYALAYSGTPDVARTVTLFENEARLSLYAKALLARTLALIGNNDERIQTLIADLSNRAVTSANGMHWEENDRDYWNWNTNTRTTAIVLGTLVQLRPDSELIPNVVRWLMVARSADAWETTQETAWALMALTDWMVVSGELDADYDYAVTFNDAELTTGTATRENITEPQKLFVEVGEMLKDEANLLTLSRGEGAGNLYYTAYLRAFLPVPEIEPLNRGIIVERRYTLLDDEDRQSITEAQIGQLVQVRLTIIALNDLHYVVIEDPIPAGTDAVDPGLATSQQIGTRPGLETTDPVRYGWGWWWFSNIEFRDEKVVLTATYLPAGTYEYVYTIRPGLEGVYNVMPPTGREDYFPDVFGRGAGSTFTILPAE